MKSYSIYNPQTGSIDKIVILPVDISESLENTPYYLEGEFSGLTQYVNVETKEVVDMPPKPGQTYVFDYYSKSWVPDENLSRYYADKQRNELLTGSDWIVVRALDRGEPVPSNWQVYRQALRDIDKQPGYPIQIDWPILSEAI